MRIAKINLLKNKHGKNIWDFVPIITHINLGRNGFNLIQTGQTISVYFCRASVKCKANIWPISFFSFSKLFTMSEKCSNFVQNLSFWGQYNINKIIICWYGYCGYGGVDFDPKMGGGTHPGGPQFWKNTSFGYKLLQKLIIICWYGYCGYGEVGCDPKMGGVAPRGGLDLGKTLLLVINVYKS